MDLGLLQEACIANPETCGEAGGAVAFWMRISHSDAAYRRVISAVDKSSIVASIAISYSTNNIL